MKTIRLLALLVLAFSFVPHHTRASQYNPVLPTTSPYPGLTMLGNINSAFQGFLSSNSGASAPSYGIEGTLYTNTSSGLLEYYSGSNWLNIGTFSSSAFVPLSNGVPPTCPTSTGSSNAYVVAYSPTLSAYVTGQPLCFKTNFSNTGSATVNFGPSALTIKKNGATNLASGDLGSGVVVQGVYDGTNFQMTSQTSVAAAGGTVTSIATTSPICGGTITGTGTLALCSQANNTVLANISGSSAAPSATSTPVLASLGLTTTTVAGTGFTGIHSPSANALALSTTGSDGLVQAANGGVTVGSPTGGSEGSGSLNTSSLYVNGVALPNSGKVSWTPVLAFGGSSTGITYSTQTGTYTKVGNLVIAEFQIALTSKGSASGVATISGLGVNINGVGTFAPSYIALSSLGSAPFGYAASTTSFALAYISSGSQTGVTDANFANNSAIEGSFIYIAQ